MRMALTLLVLAAGMGSRYGGLKQLDPVGPSGEVVLDYSVHAALRAGFEKIVYVIRRDFEREFRRVVLSRYEGVVSTTLAFQDLQDLPDGREVPAGREKPWGTGHAIWSARDQVQGPFLVVNADDFYGMEAFSAMAGFLKKSAENLQMALVAYSLCNTLSEHGTVSRGVCTVSDTDILLGVEEHSGILKEGESISGINPAGDRTVLSGRSLVSMNFWGFTPEIFEHLESGFTQFLDQGGLINPKSEYYIPSAVNEILASGIAPASVLRSSGRWYGVTYREDRQAVADALAVMVAADVYPTPLWTHTR